MDSKGVGGVVEKVYKEGAPKDMAPALICVDTFSKYVSVVQKHRAYCCCANGSVKRDGVL